MNYWLFLSIFTLLSRPILKTSAAVIAREAEGSQPTDGDILAADYETSASSLHDRSINSPLTARGYSQYWAYQFAALQAFNEKCGAEFYENSDHTVGDFIENPPVPFQPQERALNLERPGDILWTGTAAQCMRVGEHKAEYVPIFGTGTNIIGTRGLCGCIAIAIVSDAGAIVAHILPAHPVQDIMDQINDKFNQMRGQADIIAYIFNVNPGPVITEPMSNAAKALAQTFRDRIVTELGVKVILDGYDSDLTTYRWGTLVVAFNAQINAISVWVNNKVRNT